MTELNLLNESHRITQFIARQLTWFVSDSVIRCLTYGDKKSYNLRKQFYVLRHK